MKCFQRDDINHSKFLIEKLEKLKVDDFVVFKYLYSEIINNKPTKSYIIYSENDINNLKDDEEYYFVNLLCEPNRILEYIENYNGYLGYINQNKKLSNNFLLVNISNLKARTFLRSDNTSVTICEYFKQQYLVNGINTYGIYEFINENGKIVPRKDIIYTEENLLIKRNITHNKFIANTLLNCKRLDESIKNNYGYIGFVIKKEINNEYKYLKTKIIKNEQIIANKITKVI